MAMVISHVIRGEDHISNTPKQMLVIRALGAEPPVYAHMPLILGTDKKRLSKRHGAASVEELETDGFLAQPVRNALALLGWSYDDKTTTFTLDELIERFRVSRISKSPAVFDLTKLGVMNGRYIRRMPADEFEEALVEYLRKTGYLDDKGPDAEDIARRSVPLVKPKLTKLSEYDQLAGWMYRPLEIAPDAWELLQSDVKHSIQAIGGGLGRLETVPSFETAAVKEVLQDQLHIMGETSAREFLEPQRIALTGQRVSTGLYESLSFVGRDEAVRRYRETLGRLAELWTS
jgi:glutamyl-tRNA synthetase